MGHPEAPHQRGERIDREGGEGAEVEVPGGETGDRLDRGAGRLDVAQGLAGRAHQCLARGGEHEPAPHPVEEGRAQLGLQLPDGLRHRRLRHVAGLGGPGHAPLVDDGEEEGEAAQIHR